MKKIITLLLSAGIFTASYAQGNHGHKGDYGQNDQYATKSHGRYGNGDHGRKDKYATNSHGRYGNDDQDRDDSYNNRNYDQRNQSYVYQRKVQMDRINQEYYYKVMSIQHDRYMNNRQKRLAIRDAKNERNYQIQMINRNRNGYATNSYGKRHDDRDHDDGDRR